jgi:hypothetical protein
LVGVFIGGVERTFWNWGLLVLRDYLSAIFFEAIGELYQVGCGEKHTTNIVSAPEVGRQHLYIAPLSQPVFQFHFGARVELFFGTG